MQQMPKNQPWMLTEKNLPYLVETKLSKLDWTKRWKVIIEEVEDDRSLEQNARLWKLYSSVGNYLGYTKDEMHDLMGFKFLRYQVEVGGQVIDKIESTRKLSLKKMVWYQEQIEFYAGQMGWGGFDVG